jgi:hypothetical protein
LSAEIIATESQTKPLDSARLDAVLEKVLPFARIADALARGSVGKVRTLAQLGVLAAVWIAYACADTFGWQLATLVPVFVLTVIPAALLWKIHSTLHATVGLPQRIIDCAARVADKASEFRQHLNEQRGSPRPIRRSQRRSEIFAGHRWAKDSRSHSTAFTRICASGTLCTLRSGQGR